MREQGNIKFLANDQNQDEPIPLKLFAKHIAKGQSTIIETAKKAMLAAHKSDKWRLYITINKENTEAGNKNWPIKIKPSMPRAEAIA